MATAAAPSLETHSCARLDIAEGVMPRPGQQNLTETPPSSPKFSGRLGEDKMPTRKQAPVAMTVVHIGPKTVILMKDPSDLGKEMSGASPANIDTMWWARCVTPDRPEITTRDADVVRKFLAPVPESLSQDQVQSLATVTSYLLRIGHAVGGPFLSFKHITDDFGVDIETARPRLARDLLIFFTNTASTEDLTGTLHEYEYNLKTGGLRHMRSISPDPIWEKN
jgi:hypothetical protein